MKAPPHTTWQRMIAHSGDCPDCRMRKYSACDPCREADAIWVVVGALVLPPAYFALYLFAVVMLGWAP